MTTVRHLYALSLMAEHRTADGHTTEHVAGASWAASAEAARGAGLLEVRRRWPATEGWYNHSVDAHLIVAPDGAPIVAMERQHG